jgi:hypothetical protein
MLEKMKALMRDKIIIEMRENPKKKLTHFTHKFARINQI